MKNLFANVPKDHFKLPMKDFKAVGNYEADNKLYEIFQHKEQRVQIIVNVDTLKVIDVKVGRYKF